MLNSRLNIFLAVFVFKLTVCSQIVLVPILLPSIAKKHQTLLARGKGGPSRINTYYTLDTITGHETIPTPIDNILMFWTFVSRFPFVGKLCKDIGICG